MWFREPPKDGMGNFLLAKINERVKKETPTRGKILCRNYLFLFKNTTKLCNHSICGSQEIYFLEKIILTQVFCYLLSILLVTRAKAKQKSDSNM
jgi:hypothetical protein